jgi:hypothetical protein
VLVFAWWFGDDRLSCDEVLVLALYMNRITS